MTTQKQIREWIPGAFATFQSIMPSISAPYPEIHIASSATLPKLRASLVNKTRSLNSNMKEPYTSMMEMIRGEGGAAILIYQKYCPETVGEFNHTFWHELGHFYAVATEDEPFSHLAGQGLDEDRIRQTGYWVWNEFIAECISNYVGGKVNPVDKEKCKCQKYWREPYFRLQRYLDFAYSSFPASFSEYDLAFYFATLLTDPVTVAFVEGAFNDELTVWNPNKWDYVLIEPESIEPTAISTLPEIYLDPLWRIMGLLEDKVESEEFWKVDGEFLDKLGAMVTDLNDLKAMSRLELKVKESQT